MYSDAGVTFFPNDLGDAGGTSLPPDAEAPGGLLRMVERMAALPLLCDPGTEFHYSNSIDVVGCLIEQVTGKLLPDYLYGIFISTSFWTISRAFLSPTPPHTRRVL